MEYPIYFENNWRGSKAVHVKNPDNGTDAYHVNLKGGTSDMDIRRGGPQGPLVGRVDFHRFSGYTEIHFAHDQRVEMSRDRTFSSAQSLTLPAAPGKSQQFRWKKESLLALGSLKLEDSEKNVLAVFKRSSGSRTKDGTLEIKVSGLEQEFTDQIFVSYLAVSEKLRRQRQAAAAGMAASS
ncbi:hypothetical protein K504DRAFT_468726 [Pleomassaria siparia CBS 279.74]|uniref:DUF6593 domain-containing protein n=1 Tax=Pleomassaria siparia CBS 279.74 TaxID=1314801 RepID=A0A6G1K7F7_9PLEO|nr:hypothetical protein K504DRAFT_468726 [Pleomassaria siparia CBS 279.74]